MNKDTIITKTEAFVKTTLAGAEGGHDWWHVYRVWQMAKHIARKEKADMFIVELGALLHDIADSKFHNGDEKIGPEKAATFLEGLSVPSQVIGHIVNIIKHISFRGGNHTQGFYSPELAVVQDADRLDAMGAIGIARAFNYGGYKNRELHNPALKPDLQMTNATYKKNTGPTINHFYEKLLRLKDRMNTPTGKTIAKQRHRYMEGFLQHFFNEWEGKA